MLPSENYYSEAELSEIMQELQQSISDRENLQTQNSELRSEIEELKSVNSEQHEQIVKLQQSDLELKEAKKLREEAESQSSQNSIRESRLNRKEESLKAREEKIRDTESVVNSAVSKAKKEELAKLKSSYAKSEGLLKLRWGYWLTALLIWCGVILVFSIIDSPVFLTAMSDFFVAIGDGISDLVNVIWTIIPETIIGTKTENAEILIAITRIAGVLILTGLLAATYYFIVHKRIIRLIREYKLWDRFLATYSVISLQIIAYISYYWNFTIQTSNTTIIINAIALWLAFVIIYLTAVGIYRSEHPWVIGNR